jgi:hypothetical protein
MDWIHLVQDRVQWRVLLDAVIYLPNSIKDGKFFDHLSDYKILKKDPVPQS